MVTLRLHLVLGRVSNLPTVWTNALAGAVLSGAGMSVFGWVALLVSLSLFYVGGMYLNDAYDAEIDAKERSGRPIPMGAIARELVFILGFAFLGIGAVLGFLVGLKAGLAGLALAGSVILYDWLHKRTHLSPLIMGACRLLTYAMAALAAGGLGAAVLVGAIGLFAHVVGLTYAAKQEAYNRMENAWPLAVLAIPVIIALWDTADMVWSFVLTGVYLAWVLWSLRFLFRRMPGDVPRGVVNLIAGISLYDAALVAGTGSTGLAILAALGFLATLLLQRVAPGT